MDRRWGGGDGAEAIESRGDGVEGMEQLERRRWSEGDGAVRDCIE